MSKRLPKKAAPINKIRNKSLEFMLYPYKKLSNAQRFWIGFIFVSVVTSLLINNPFPRLIAPEYKEGDIARQSIISPTDIIAENKKETVQIKKVLVESIKPIFNYQSDSYDQAIQSFRAAWEKLQRPSPEKNINAGNEAESKWHGLGGGNLGKIFTSRQFSGNELDSIIRVLRDSSKRIIYDDKDRQLLKGDVTLIDRQKPGTDANVSMPEVNWIPLSKAREKLSKSLLGIRSLSEIEAKAFEKALVPLVQPNVFYDKIATEKAKEDVIKGIEPVMILLKRGQIIVREGDTITAKAISEIEAIKSYSNLSRRGNRFLGLLILVTSLFWVSWKFIQHRGHVNRLHLSEEKTFALFGFIVLIQTVLMAIFFQLASYTALQSARAPLNDPTTWALATPFAFSSLLMTLLADRKKALFTGFFCALLAGLLASRGLEFAIYAFITSAAAVYGIGHYRSRQSVTVAGAMVGVASAFTAVALIAYTQQPFILNTILLAVMCGLVSGLVTAASAAVFLPICETLFGILTDVKLLELSNADLPALGQLALRAPGTNQHSHAVGQLAEEACRKVGANGLLARIGALYHDIGKTAAPDHFVENQIGENPHDKLKPSQSSKIIISHVTYGTKLAKEMGLPARIVDFISQHHGTRTLHYFLTRAKEEAGKGEEIHESDFRYPGPKPQFKESAIMMIADSCEAAARSLSEPTPENIRFIVTKIIDAILSDDQLDECDLTLRELTQIRESMIKSLISIYHSRVDYPGYSPPSKLFQSNIVPKDMNEDKRGTHYTNPADIPISKGGEIEGEAVTKISRQREKVKANEETSGHLTKSAN